MPKFVWHRTLYRTNVQAKEIWPKSIMFYLAIRLPKPGMQSIFEVYSNTVKSFPNDISYSCI